MPQVRFPGESPEHRRARALRERVDDLRGARQRIIDAADAERRRIERDLHDGAQQRMVAVAAHARPRRGAARRATRRARRADRPGARGGAARGQGAARARARHPPGACSATAGSARRSRRSPRARRCRSRSRACPPTRLGHAVEAAAYFVTAEALTNVAKYAHASAAFVHLAVEDGRLRLQIRDDGVGGADLASGAACADCATASTRSTGASRSTRRPAAARRSPSRSR